MKILIKGDSHFDLISSSVKRTDEIVETYERLVNLAIKLKVDLFVDLGDIFDSNNPTMTSITKVIELLMKLKKHDIDVRIINGNHEKINRPIGTSTLDFLKAAGFQISTNKNDFVEVDQNVIIMNIPWITEAETRSLTLDGWSRNQYFENTLKLISDNWKNKDIYIFSHLDMGDYDSGDNFTFPEGWFDLKCKSMTVFNGHIHEPSDFEMNGHKVYNVGSTNFTAFDQVEDKRCLLLNTRTGDVRSILTGAKRFMSIKVDKTSESHLRKFRKDIKGISDTFVKVELYYEEGDDVSELRKMIEDEIEAVGGDLIKIDPIPKVKAIEIKLKGDETDSELVLKFLKEKKWNSKSVIKKANEIIRSCIDD